MLSRYLARRKMRWAVRHRQDWIVQFWVNQRRKAREPRDWPIIFATTTYGAGERAAGERLERFYFGAHEELLVRPWSNEQLDLTKLAKGEDVGHDDLVIDSCDVAIAAPGIINNWKEMRDYD
jgi:hypothetical protein